MSKGYQIFDIDQRVLNWIGAANNLVSQIDVSERRHGGTWFVGVDALENAIDGSVLGVPLGGAWQGALDQHPMFDGWHKAQVSIVYPGYPLQDADESDANHRYRTSRDAAHMDGLLPEGPMRRRHLREPHAFVLGLPLDDVPESPLVVWPESQKIMRAAFTDALSGYEAKEWGDVDVTAIYQTARSKVFETCERVETRIKPGQAILLNRHLIHGVAPWRNKEMTDPRKVAYFRPQVRNIIDWL